MFDFDSRRRLFEFDFEYSNRYFDIESIRGAVRPRRPATARRAFAETSACRAREEGIILNSKIHNKRSAWPFNCPINPQQWAFLQRKYHFTPRELQVAIAVCWGCNNKEIAEKLDVELNTAKVYLRAVYLKVGVNNKITLLLRFLEDIS